MEALRIQADAIIVSSEQIHRPGQIVVAHGEVIEQTSRCTERPDIILNGKMLAPALINAHTHLEFSDLQSPIAAGATFPQWIGSVIRHRRSLAESHSPEALEQLRRDALQRGLAESHQAGVAIVADIVTAPWMPATTHPLRSLPQQTLPKQSLINSPRQNHTRSK